MNLPPHRVILLMVHELHRLGYQRLRIQPSMAPSGVHWRCTLASAAHFSARFGAELAVHTVAVARYGSGHERAYFGWQDAAGDTPKQLARKFIERFPEVCAQSWGPDWIYAGWYMELLRLTEPAGAPIVYADWELDPNVVSVIGESAHQAVALPPPGEHEP
jgi:hypothetical protein